MVWEVEFARANYHRASVYAVSEKDNDTKETLDAELAAKEAYKAGDFSYDKLKTLLEAADFKPGRNCRGDPFAGEDGEKGSAYYTFGLFTHGGVQGITKLTIEKSHLCRYVNAFGKHHLGSSATWSSFTLSYDVKAGVHHDYNNLAGTLNYSCSFGQDKGGFLWIEDRSLSEEQCNQGGVVWKRDKGKGWLPGIYYDTDHKFVSFDPQLKHCVTDWKGHRWSVSFHTTRGLPKVGKEIIDYLKKVGCALPRAGQGHGRVRASGDNSKLPRKSTRKSLAHSAVKLLHAGGSSPSGTRSRCDLRVGWNRCNL